MVRDSPWDEPRWWRRSNRSRSSTRAPREAAAYAAQLPMMPAPATITSNLPPASLDLDAAMELASSFGARSALCFGFFAAVWCGCEVSRGGRGEGWLFMGLVRDGTVCLSFSFSLKVDLFISYKIKWIICLSFSFSKVGFAFILQN